MNSTIYPRLLFAKFLIWMVILLSPMAKAADQDAKYFIMIATGVMPSDQDARIQLVSSQFSEIHASCARTSSGAAIWDKLSKGHSLMKTPQSLLVLLSDFVRVARASCDKLDDTTLIALYVIERDAGYPHSTVINRLIRNPRSLVQKYGN